MILQEHLAGSAKLQGFFSSDTIPSWSIFTLLWKRLLLLIIAMVDSEARLHEAFQIVVQ